MNRQRHKPSYEIYVYNKDTHKYVGTIRRKTTHESNFGNMGAVEYSIMGKKYWIVGGEQSVSLPESVIAKLKAKGELKK